MKTFGGGNQFGINTSYEIDMADLPTLPVRMTDRLREALAFHLKDVAERIIEEARGQMRPHPHAPGAIRGPHVDIPGGLDTGKLAETLTQKLVEGMEAYGVVAYDILSEEAEYWQWIEFGHWVRAKAPWFWPGFHLLEGAIMNNIPALRRAARAAWHDAAIALAAEARHPLPGIHPGGTSSLLHR